MGRGCRKNPPQVNPVMSIFGGTFPSASQPQSMCTCSCKRLIPSLGSSQLGHLHFPVAATSIPAQPPQSPMGWIPPQPLQVPSSNFPGPHAFSPERTPLWTPIAFTLAPQLLHPISYALLAPCSVASLAYPWLARGLCLEPCPLLLSDAPAPLRTLWVLLFLHSYPINSSCLPSPRATLWLCLTPSSYQLWEGRSGSDSLSPYPHHSCCSVTVATQRDVSGGPSCTGLSRAKRPTAPTRPHVSRWGSLGPWEVPCP